LQHSDRGMPRVLRELLELEFDYAGGNGMDFEPYSEFLPEEDTRSWIQAWTGNKELSGEEYLVFGQDGSGGYAAVWCVREDKGLLDQPIVFFGSEGELGIIAENFSSFLWLLAGGFGPYEAIAYPGENREANATLAAFAHRYANSAPISPNEVLAKAHREFPTFEDDVRSSCK
jgi:predicted dehydrogenase